MRQDTPNQSLHEALRALSEETARQQVSMRVSSTLLAEVRKRRRRNWLASWKPWAMVAPAVAVALVFVLAPKREIAKPPVSSQVVVPALPAPSSAGTEAVEPLEPAMAAVVRAPMAATTRAVRRPRPKRWSDIGEPRALTPWYVNSGLPMTGPGELVLIDIDAATARQWGAPVVNGGAKAQVFLGDDGMARAFRVVSTKGLAKGE